MRLKTVITALAAIVFIVAGLLSVIFFARPGDYAAAQYPPRREPSETLNTVIGEAAAVYASAPYRRYSREELQKYFSGEIADGILENYEPFIAPGEETLIEFEEQPVPEIKTADISYEGGEYTVKLKFGEVFYNYRLTVTPSRIITKITDGGITFE